MSGKPTSSSSSQITLSPRELSTLVNKAVSEVLATQEAKKYTATFPELPKLKSPSAVWPFAPDISKSFVPKPLYFDSNKK